MNVLEFLINELYRLAEGDEFAQKMIRAVAEGYNERMAEINRREGVNDEQTQVQANS